MTPEEITKLTEEYGEAQCGSNRTICFVREKLQMEEKLRWLLRTHCIVSKEKVAEIKENSYLKEYEFLKERCIEDLNPERMDWHDMHRLCDGMYYALKQLLDEIFDETDK